MNSTNKINNIDLINLAKLMAEKAHSTQSYGDMLPYMYHINSVADFGYTYIPKTHPHFVELICALYLHDIIEDQNVSYNDVKGYFGELVAEIVWALSGWGRNRKERNECSYKKIRKLELAKVAKLCDRLANVTHSSSFNKGKIAMYRKENEEFLRNTEIDISKDSLVVLLKEVLEKLLD